MIKLKKSAFRLVIAGIIILFSVPNGWSEAIEDIIENASPRSAQEPDQTEAQTSGEMPSPEPGRNQLYALQIGAFLMETAAEEKIIELKNAGYDPYIFQTVNSKNQTIYSVRIGRYKDYESAAQGLADLREDLNLPAFIAYYDSLEPAAKEAAAPEPRPPVFAQAEEPMAESAPEEPVEPVEAAPEPAPEASPEASMESLAPPSKQPEGPPTLESLQRQIREMEASLKRLSEEAEARKKLEMTEEEQAQRAQEEDILEAAGKEYTLTRGGNIEFTYGFGYTYSEYDAIRESVKVEDVCDHSISNSLGVSYGVLDNLNVSTSIPWVYEYDRVGTVDSKDETGIGDLSLGWQYQPFRPTEKLPTIIINGGFTVPSGKSPYEIMYGEELSTGSGIYSASLGVSVSQVSDPVVVFGSLSLSYPFDVTDLDQKRPEGELEEVDPGMGIGVGAGMGYALSYKLNLNFSFGYSYSFETTYKYKNNVSAESGTSASAHANLGVGYRLNRYQTINFRVGIPITESREFSFSFWTPIEFEL